MRLYNSLLVLVLCMVTMLPCALAVEQEAATKFSDYELMNKCSTVALKYVTGDKVGAQQLAKELLPSAETKYRERHVFGTLMNMLNAVINNDDNAVENYMENNYEPHDTELEGFKFGLKEALAERERFMVLTAAAPLDGPLSRNYLCDGVEVASLMYSVGQIDQAKSLAKDLLSLVERLQDAASKKAKSPYVNYEYNYKERLLKAIIDDKKDVVAEYIQKDPNTTDSIGYRLELAYGKIYLIKRLKMDLDHLAFAYYVLGQAQALAGNYDESERAYKMVLRLARSQYGSEYPEVLLWIRSDYAAMLKLAGKPDEAAQVAKGLTREYVKEVEAKAHPDRKADCLYPAPPGWGP